MRILVLVLSLVLTLGSIPCSYGQVAETDSPVFSSELEMKISYGQFLVRRKGATDWKPSTAFKEPLEIGSYDGDHKIFLVSKSMKGPKPKHLEPATLPGEKGFVTSRVVVLHAVVDEQGTVRFPVADKTPGPKFTSAALAALKKWRFEPAKLDGHSVAVMIVITMEFL